MRAVTRFLLLCATVLAVPATAVVQPASAFSPNPDRPAQPPGRPTLQFPFKAVPGSPPGQRPDVTTPYGAVNTHSDEYQCIVGCHSYYALDFGQNGQSFPVAAAAAGTLTYLPSDEAGNTVFVDHGNGWKTKYGHLSTDGVIVRGNTLQKGESVQVSAGEVFANSGSTGTTGGIHLHFELRATYWPGESPRTWSTTWSYPPYELYGQPPQVYGQGKGESFVTEDPALVTNFIGNDTISAVIPPLVPAGDLAAQKVVSLYENTYYSFGRCENFWNEDRDLSDNYIGINSVSSWRVGTPCPSAATPAPTSFSVVATSPTTIRLSWSASSPTPIGYALYEAEKLLIKVVRGTTTSHAISDLQPGSTHCYYVYAFYKAGSSEIQWACATTQR